MPRAQCWNDESKRFMGKVMEISGLGQSTFLPDGERQVVCRIKGLAAASLMPLQTLGVLAFNSLVAAVLSSAMFVMGQGPVRKQEKSRQAESFILSPTP